MRLNGSLIFFGVILLLVIAVISSSFVVVQPNERGVVVVLGKAKETPIGPGLNFVMPIISKVHKVKTANYKYSIKTMAFSQDLQSVAMVVNVVGRVVPERAVSIVVDYRDSLSDTILLPQLSDTIKEVTAQYTAEKLVKSREAVRAKIMEILKQRLQQYNVYVIEDVVIENIDLSDVLERAIEEKMVQEQQAERAKFAQQQARIEAETKIIAAKGEAEALNLRGRALVNNKEIVALNAVEKWNGVMPTTLVTDGSGGIASIFVGGTPGTQSSTARR
ncbi:prohibitin 2 [Elusimicrobium simillimum]|uniref:prohibitin family protein n=1 Tax=Elusimicrobium simillimum TaxID=3143438 RepID=UPI003C6F17FE